MARLLAHQLFRALVTRARFLLWRFCRFDLRFDVLAFPTTCHAYIVTQNPQIAGISVEKKRDKHQAPAALRCGSTGNAGRITPRMVDSATRARCSAKTP